jgi:hypothetical protein
MTMNARLTTIVCMGILIALAIPAVSAWSPGQSWDDNPEHIAAMQAYVAYSAELYKAKMNGAIQYISGLNGTVGTGTLQTDEQQFLATAATVPSMTSSTAITQARNTMKTEISQFRIDLSSAFSADSGNLDNLKAAVTASVNADQTSIQSLNTAYWTETEKSRLDEFTYYDSKRTATLTNLTAKGVDVTPAQLIETQLQALQPSLKVALDSRNQAQIDDVNRQLSSLGKQFGTQVSNLDSQVREKNRLAWFDNRTAQMKSEIANLTAKHIDTSQAEGILDQFQAQRDPLKVAYENHDQQNINTLVAQLNALSKQFYDLTHGDIWWQTHETSALAAFDNSTARMEKQIANLSAQGADVTQARAVLDQIKAERATLKAAYDTHDKTALTSVENQLKSLDQQYRTAIQAISGWDSRETKRLAEFDKNVASWKSTLDNLKAHGVDVSAGEGIIDQIQAERDPLKTAFGNHDQAALDSINTQLSGLEQQLKGLIKGYENPLSRNTSGNQKQSSGNGNYTKSSSSPGTVI